MESSTGKEGLLPKQRKLFCNFSAIKRPNWRRLWFKLIYLLALAHDLGNAKRGLQYPSHFFAKQNCPSVAIQPLKAETDSELCDRNDGQKNSSSRTLRLVAQDKLRE